MGDKGDGADLQRVSSYQWPTGHVAHLSEGQSGALERFKKLSQKKGYYDPGDDKTPPTHDDETLLRYLRARKFLPQEAFAQFKDTEDWRKENQIDSLYETIDIHEYDQTRRLYPQWTGRRDKRGIPFYVFQIADVDPKDVSASANRKDGKKQPTNTKTPWKMLKLFALYENLCRFVLPMCSAIPDRLHSETPISQSNNIVDLNGVGFAKLWNLRSHMSDASTLATAHYPETLDRIFVVGAPSFFPTIWQWAQRWFDPITVSKIFILPQKDMTSTLAQYVDMDNIPKKYGGHLDWKFGDMPNLEPGIANNLKWKQTFELNGHKTLPIGPIKLEYDKDGDLVATAVGTEKGKPRDLVIAGLHPEAGVARLALLPGRVDNNSKKSPTTTSVQILNSEKHPPAHNNNPISANHSPPAPDKKMSNDANLNVGKDPHSAVDGTSIRGTYTVPYNDKDSSISSPPQDTRTGTSSTRYQQQEGTHAEGAMAQGTPEVKKDSQGSRQGVMDPNTVGQAPKEHPLPIPEEPQPSVIDQAKDMAGQAVEQAKALPTTVMSAVGMGDKRDEAKLGAEEAKKEDPVVDKMESKDVEDFLRSRTMSKPEA